MRLIIFTALFALLAGLLWAFGLLLEPEGVAPANAAEKDAQANSDRGPPGKRPF